MKYIVKWNRVVLEGISSGLTIPQTLPFVNLEAAQRYSRFLESKDVHDIDHTKWRATNVAIWYEE